MREIDLAAIRARLAGDQGKTWWRVLEELADTDEFRELLHRGGLWIDPTDPTDPTDPSDRTDRTAPTAKRLRWVIKG